MVRGSRHRERGMADSWTRGAGLLLHTRSNEGRSYVLLGERAERLGRMPRLMASLAMPLHGWSLPFGTLAAEDSGDYARCAIRETAEEVLGLEGKPYDMLEQCLARNFGIEAGAWRRALEPHEGWAGNLLQRIGGRLFGLEYRTYAVRIPYTHELVSSHYPGNKEFPKGLDWCHFVSPSDVRRGEEGLPGPRHYKLRATLAHFRKIITG